MATHTNLSSLFTDIADSIRSVSGGTASIQADTFPTAIQSLGSGFAKIQTGSYVGTGTYGASNPCSLTFDFQLSLIIFFDDELVAKVSSNYYNGGSDSYSLVIRKIDTISSVYNLGRIPLADFTVSGYYNQRSGTTLQSTAKGYTKFSNKILSWYVAPDKTGDYTWYCDNAQLNSLNKKYAYLGL